ncbi:hypothetical protein DFH29DRAFT_1001722 [Suillus ampliporus]|nr:hypothetical protein DFH29DRAFT_1001722 [Suillus ampliporus]
MADQFGATIYSPPPGYMDSSSVVPGDDFIHKQFGSGHRHLSPLPELTPTRLRTNIKATSRDVSIAREANIRCQAHPIPSPQPVQSASPLTSLADVVTPLPCQVAVVQAATRHRSHFRFQTAVRPLSDTASLPLSHHLSPFLGDPPSQHPAHLNDLFMLVQVQQPPWPGHDTTHDFNFMVDNSFPSMLLSDPVTGMTAAGGQNETQWADPPPPLNLIPPTPLKDIDDMAPRGTLGGNTFTRVSSQQLDLSYYPSNAHARERFPEENPNLIDRESSLQEQSLTGRRSSETNDKLEEGFALIDCLFNDLSKSTMMPTNQVINTYLKSRGQEVHSINYWNIYANYFKEYKERELARLTTGGSENDKGKGKEIANVEVHGTPGMAMRRLCYEKFKEAFPNDYQDILINQDASLGHVHTTPAAAGFFETRCRANDDTIIGHLKAHVFNETSLSVVEDAFKDSEVKDDICDVDTVSSLKDDTSENQLSGG